MWKEEWQKMVNNRTEVQLVWWTAALYCFSVSLDKAYISIFIIIQWIFSSINLVI